MGRGGLCCGAGCFDVSGCSTLFAIRSESSRRQPVQRHVGWWRHGARRLHLLSFSGADVLPGFGRAKIGAAVHRLYQGSTRSQSDGAAFSGAIRNPDGERVEFVAGFRLHVAAVRVAFRFGRNGRQPVAGTISASEEAQFICSADRSRHAGDNDRASRGGRESALKVELGWLRASSAVEHGARGRGHEWPLFHVLCQRRFLRSLYTARCPPVCEDPGCTDGGQVVGISSPRNVVARILKDHRR